MNYIVTTNPERRRLWQRIFDTDKLPVKSSQPRLMCLPAQGELLAYDLDAKSLHQFSLIRFADYLTNKYGLDAAIVDVDGWPILAEDCRLARDVTPHVGFAF